MNTREAAALYISFGWYPVPLKEGLKDLRDREGLKKVYEASEFEEDDNIGLHLVSAGDKYRSVKLVAVDFDAPEITPDAVWTFLPKTCGWGRPSKAISQLLFVSPFDRSVVLTDRAFAPDPQDERKKATLIEIRAEHQSMCPPSVHPNGERLEWISGCEPLTAESATVVEQATLKRCVDLLATYAMVARYYNQPKNRHFWGLYLAGFLRQLGVTVEEAVDCVRLAALWRKDREVKDRLDAIKNTYARPEDDALAGAGKLQDEIDTEGAGKKFVATLKRIWGAGGTGFATNEKGDKIIADSSNIVRALVKMDVKLSWNVFANRTTVQNGDFSRTLDDGTVTHLWLEIERRYGFRAQKDYFLDVVKDTAREAPFHPVLDYLAKLEWDGKPRVDRWLIDYGGAVDSPYVRVVGSLVLIAAVRRVRKPGCKFDELLVLESKQGQNKSTALRTLCPNEEWFSDDFPLGLDAKETIERSAGRWIIEVAELVGSKREAERLKASLSRQVDGPVRMAYGHIPDAVPRQFVIIGTTNRQAYLKDPTGARRFWPVTVRPFNVPKLLADRDQLWAEASARESVGESIRMDSSMWSAAEEEQEERQIVDPWESIVEQFCATLDSKEGRQRVPNEAIWTAIGVSVDRRDERGSERIYEIMRRLSFRRIAHRIDGRTIKVWGRNLVDGIWRPPGW